MSLRCACLSFLILIYGCVHPSSQPSFTHFPPQFYVEQRLVIQLPDTTKTLRAQVEKRGERVDLLLVEPLWGVTLLRAAITQAGAVSIAYQAPDLAEHDFPVAAIAQSIAHLYWGQNFEKKGDSYELKVPDTVYTYTLRDIWGEPSSSCLFPREIDLHFADARYAIKIETTELQCEVAP